MNFAEVKSGIPSSQSEHTLMLRVSILMWQVRINSIMAFGKMQSWGMDCRENCLLCDDAVGETTSHLFFNCVHLKELPFCFTRVKNNAIWEILDIDESEVRIGGAGSYKKGSC